MATRPASREEWESLFLGSSTARVATRSDTAIAKDLGLTRQAVQRRREGLKIGKHVPAVEIETPPADAPIRVVAGWRIRQHRIRRGWTTTAMAQALGGSWIHSAVSGVELARSGRSRRGLTVESLALFAAVLGVTPADLLLRPGQTRLAELPEQPSAEQGDPPIDIVIGLNVARWRDQRGLTQVELERRISGRTANSRISDIERGGIRWVMLETLEEMAHALDITPADLVRLPRQPPLTGQNA